MTQDPDIKVVASGLKSLWGEIPSNAETCGVWPARRKKTS